MAQLIINQVQVGSYGFPCSEMQGIACRGRLIKKPHEKFRLTLDELSICQADFTVPHLYARLKNLYRLGSFIAAQNLLHMLKKKIRGYRYCLHMGVNFTHKMLNSEHLPFIFKAEGLCHFLLVVKEKLVIFAAAHIVQPVANADQVILGLLKPVKLLLGEKACLLQRYKVLQPENNLGCPHHGLDITKPAAALLNLRLKKVCMSGILSFPFCPLGEHIIEKSLALALDIGSFVHFSELAKQ